MTQEMHTMSSEIPKQKFSVQDGISKPVNWLSHSIPVFFLLLTVVFSTNGFGIVCTGVNYVGNAGNQSTYLTEDPNDPVRNFVEGLYSYCAGKKEIGISYMERASDMGHITASYALALYYRSDRTGDVSKIVPEIQENYDAAIFYYERVAEYIKSANNYPYNTYRGIPEVEGRIYISIRTFLSLSNLYYNGYVRAIKDMLRNDVSYTDTIKVLVNMQSAAERCLNRPSLAAWKGRRSEIAHSKQVICGAYKSFADRAFNLESQRKEISKQCGVPLKDCDEHKNVVSQLIQASKEMGNQLRSVPAI